MLLHPRLRHPFCVRRLRRNRVESRKSSKSCEEVFLRLVHSEAISPDALYDAVTSQCVEVVLTAHPTQV